jgi:leucyl aminopeptidase
MKSDMSGAAAVLAAMYGVAELKPKVRVIGVMGLTENAIGPDAYRPSDIYTAYNGKTVEITNTDAEGRLVLADALAYVIAQYKPTGVIDIATLTGAAKIALGQFANAIFANDEKWQRAVADSAERVGERLWPLPLYEEYSEEIKSPIAQLRNAVTNHRWGGASTAAAFLKEFVGKTPWVHLDIAPTAFPGHPSPIQPKATASGAGVRTMLELVTTTI